MNQNTQSLILSELLKAPKNEYVSSSSLAFSLNVSNRTILKYLTILKKELSEHGAELVMKQGSGCILVIHEQDLFDDYYKQLIKSNENDTDTPEGRRKQLLNKLISTNTFLNIYHLADELYVSPSLLRKDIRYLLPIIKRYDLELKHSHNNGYMIVGDEKNIRKCIYRECMNTSTLMVEKSNIHKTKILNQLHDAVSEALSSMNITTTVESINSLSIHILIAINRIETGDIMAYDASFDEIKNNIEYQAALVINKSIQDIFHISLPDNELCYFSLHINGKKRTFVNIDEDSILNREAIIFYNLFLRGILKIYNLDLFDDKDLMLNLVNHIPPFLNRYKNKMQIRKSNLSIIKDEFPFAYELAVCGLSYAFKNPEVQISEEETLYFSLHLALAIDKKDECMIKYNIAVVSNDPVGIFKLISNKLSRQLHQQINIIQLFSYDELSDKKLEQFDLLINTTNMKLSFEKPTVYTQQFLSDNDIEIIRLMINKLNKLSQLGDLLSKKLFFTIQAKEREELLTKLIKYIQPEINLPNEFYESVLERERLGSTAYSNKVAVPHPLHPGKFPSFIAVCRLAKPIMWSDKYVQLVFLVSFNAATDSTRIFFDRLSKAVMDKNLIQQLLKAENYEEFIDIFLN